MPTANLSALTAALAKVFTELSTTIDADADKALDPKRAAELRENADRGRKIAEFITGAGEKVDAATAEKLARLRAAVVESRTESGLRDVDPINEHAPVGTQYRRILAGNLIADLGKHGVDRLCGVYSGNGHCVLKEGHMPPRYDDSEPYHADPEQAARARRYLIHSDPDRNRRA